MSRTVRSANDRFRSCKIPLSCLRHIALCHLAGFVSLFYIDVTRYPRMSCYISFLQTFDTLRFLIQYSVFKVQCNLGNFQALKACFHKLGGFQDYSVPARDRATFVARCIVSDTVEMEGFEPLTPCLQGRCSPN